MSKRARVHGHRRRRRLTVTFNIHRTNSRSILTRLCRTSSSARISLNVDTLYIIRGRRRGLSCHFLLRRLGTPRATRIRPPVSPLAAPPRSHASGRITTRVHALRRRVGARDATNSRGACVKKRRARVLHARSRRTRFETRTRRPGVITRDSSVTRCLWVMVARSRASDARC